MVLVLVEFPPLASAGHAIKSINIIPTVSQCTSSYVARSVPGRLIYTRRLRSTATSNKTHLVSSLDGREFFSVTGATILGRNYSTEGRLLPISARYSLWPIRAALNYPVNIHCLTRNRPLMRPPLSPLLPSHQHHTHTPVFRQTEQRWQ